MIITIIFWTVISSVIIVFASMNVLTIAWTINRVRKMIFGDKKEENSEEI